MAETSEERCTATLSGRHVFSERKRVSPNGLDEQYLACNCGLEPANPSAVRAEMSRIAAEYGRRTILGESEKTRRGGRS